MKRLFSRQSIIEGDMYPDTLIWFGKILPLHGSATIGTCLMIKLPWWWREEVWTLNGPQTMTVQLTFFMHHFKGYGPEKYEFVGVPCERDT